MGPERLDPARTVELIAAVTASGRPPWAGAVLVRYPPRAAGLAAGAAVGLPGAPAGGRGELVFPTVDSGGRSVGAGRGNRPYVAGVAIAPAQGHHAWTGLQCRLLCAGRTQLVERGADPATGKTAPPWFQLPWPRSRACRFRLWTCPPPAMSPSPRAVHPLHPMTAGHATGHKQGRNYSDRRSDLRRLRMGHSRPPGGAAKAVLSRSSPPPERLRLHSLAGAPGSRGGSAPVV